MSFDYRKVLVSGLKEVNAGKTSVARALLGLMQDEGLKPCGFKPMAGNDLWYDYDVVQEALSQGRLYGKDSKLLKEASNTILWEEAISPVHRLHGIPSDSPSYVLDGNRGFIADRVSIWNDGQRQITILNNRYPGIRDLWDHLRKLLAHSNKVVRVSNAEELNSVTKAYYGRAVESAHTIIAKSHDSIVYESYSDVALPWSGIVGLDAVLLVEPGHIYCYDPDRYMSALRIQGSILNEGTTGRIAPLLDPQGTLTVPPCRSERIIGWLSRGLRTLLG
jgi:predicted P-loop ATPase/GTPase